MPTNKNALTRYKYLDDLLSDRHHYYDIHDLTDLCNDHLVDAGFPEVTQRCIEKDLNYLEYAPFNADIERFRWNGKNCIRYANPSFSIFSQEMSKEERMLLHEVLSTLGQFEGLNHFEWLEKFTIGLGIDNSRKIISFSTNPYLKNSKLLGTLFDVISNRQVIELSYHKFLEQEVRSVVFHPYQLKQYNNRWYVLGSPDDNEKIILNFALDRLDGITPLPEKKYKECIEDLSEHFDDIVGVTLYADKSVEKIVMWISDKEFPYIETKPIHPSQKLVKTETVCELRNRYPLLEGGHFLQIECIHNYELVRELASYFGELIVISPQSLQDAIYEEIHTMHEKYLKIRT
jgi:predicted DNA-binding transcriptional regulator YafY